MPANSNRQNGVRGRNLTPVTKMGHGENSVIARIAAPEALAMGAEPALG